MKTIYLHIGTIKTGTTYIQKAFHDNQSVFERFEISYPYITPCRDERYGNADFTTDQSLVQEAHDAFAASVCPNVLISEEGIFGSIGRLNHPAFDGLPKKVILYVRRPADLILSWAAENAEPYNAFIHNRDGEPGPLPIPALIEILANEYEGSIGQFIEQVDRIGQKNFIIRPMERSRLKGGDLLTDFLDCLGLDADHVRADPEFRDPGMVNESRSRKFCDVSNAVWNIMGKPNQPKEGYDVHLVEAVTSACESGDERNVVDTVSDEIIERLSDRFFFFEEFLSNKFFGGAPFFSERYPPVFRTEREPYRPVDWREVELLTELILLRKKRANAA